MGNYKGNVSASGIVLGSLIAQGGPQGETGKEGYTPIKGVDYYTEAEKQEIVQGITTEVEGKIEPLEHERQLNEQERIVKENTRLEKEIERQNAELARRTNEDIRQQNEAIREMQESEREDSENRRMETFSQMQKDVELAINNIEDMTDAYNRNASEKTNDFNNNVTSKTEMFNANAASKTDVFNQNSTNKTTEFNENAQEKINEFNTNAAALENRVSNLETDNANNKQDILNIKTEQNTQNTKLTDLENKNTEQDEEITNIKTEQETQNNRLNDIEGKNTTQDETIQELQKSIADLQSYNETNDANMLNIQLEQEEQNNDITMLKGSDYFQNKSIEDLQNQIIELETENENIKNQIPVGEPPAGEYITINDSSDMPFKLFRPGGNSWQETRSGKNLFDKTQNFNKTNTSVDDWTITQLDTGVRILSQYVEGSPNIKYHLLDLTNYVGKTVRAKSDFVGSANNQGKIILGICDKESSNSTKYAETTVSGETISFVVPELEEGKTLLYVILYANYNGTQTSGNYVDYTNLIITIDNEDMTYEQYGAMPSPEFRSENRNVGDNVNLFNINELPTDIFEINGTEFKAISSPANKTIWNNNSGYTGDITFKWKYKVFDTSLNARGLYLRIYKTDGTYVDLSSYLNKDGEEEIVVDNVDYAVTGFGNSYKNTIYDFKIEKGSKATPYSPHNCGNANISVCNKNFFNASLIPSSCGVTVTDNGKTIIMPVATDGNGYVYTGKTLSTLSPNLKVGDKAILRFIRNLGYTHNNKIYLQGIALTWTIDTEKTITQEMLDSIVALYGNAYTYGETGQCILTDFSIMLSSVTDTSWQPHESQQICFPLSEGQRMPIGSYPADDGLHHKRGHYIFTGTETINIGANYTNTTRFIINSIVGKIDGKVLCNCLVEGTAGKDIPNIDMHGVSGSIVMTVPNSIATTVEQLKAYLAEQYANGTPVIVEYELAEPIIEPYTEAQQLVYNEIKKAHSYKNVTHIFSTDEIKPINKVIYRKDWETLNQKQEQRLLALENAVLGGN